MSGEPVELGGGGQPNRIRWARPFESGHNRARWTIGLFGLAAAAEIGSFVLACGGPSLAPPGSVHAAHLSGLQSTTEAILIGSIVALAIWTHRVYRNLPALGSRQLHFTPGWAAAWLFIPLANLVIPYFVFREIWFGSMPTRGGQNAAQQKPRTSLLLIAWWTLNILPVVVLVVGAVVLCLAIENSPDPWQAVDRLSGQIERSSALFVSPLAAAAAILAIFVVRHIDKNQQARFDQLRQNPAAN
jgi:hypothetical protein